MFWWNLMVVSAGLAVALFAGIGCGVVFKPPERHCDQEILAFVGMVFFSVLLIEFVIYLYLENREKFRVEKQ